MMSIKMTGNTSQCQQGRRIQSFQQQKTCKLRPIDISSRTGSQHLWYDTEEFEGKPRVTKNKRIICSVRRRWTWCSSLFLFIPMYALYVACSCKDATPCKHVMYILLDLLKVPELIKMQHGIKRRQKLSMKASRCEVMAPASTEEWNRSLASSCYTVFN